MDYNKYLDKIKYKTWKKLKKLSEILPTDKLELINITPYNKKNNQGAKHEIEIKVNDKKYYWRVSNLIAKQILEHIENNDENNVFYIHKVEKETQGRYRVNKLYLSTKALVEQSKLNACEIYKKYHGGEIQDKTDDQIIYDCIYNHSYNKAMKSTYQNWNKFRKELENNIERLMKNSVVNGSDKIKLLKMLIEKCDKELEND